MTTALAIDTASANLAVVLGTGEGVLAEWSEPSGQDHSRLLLPAIDRVLKAGVRPDLVVAVSGPGSYAGLRVGIATAQGFALGRGLPVVGVPTLEAVAAASGLNQVRAIHPAGRGEYAIQDFSGGKAQGLPRLAAAGDLGPNCAGEGAGDAGGIEVAALERCRAALRLGIEQFEQSGGAAVVPSYLREPGITRPKHVAGSSVRGA
ncbi:MAG: tRNA (adenosine(37)-N6)-threonylcarbamoyltransferase complex dimerization subunit type 1 TsaB [Dehalococcoidia bacterium]